MILVDHRHLFGLRIGHIDTHLLAATLLTAGARLWTRDNDGFLTGSADWPAWTPDALRSGWT